MSLPDGAEYWQDVKSYFGRPRSHTAPKAHAPAEGVSLRLEPGEDTREAKRVTRCGETLRHDRLRAKRKYVTCRNCLAELCRYVVTHEVGGVRKVLLATDDVMAAQNRYYEAMDNKLVDVHMVDRVGGP